MSYTFNKLALADSLNSETISVSLAGGYKYANTLTVTRNGTREAVLSSSVSDLAHIPTIRFARNVVNDIYAGSGMKPEVLGLSRKGFSVLIQVNDFLLAQDATATPSNLAMPVSAHLVFKIPEQLPEGTDAQTLARNLLTELLLACSEDSQVMFQPSDGRLNSLVRGNLLPIVLR